MHFKILGNYFSNTFHLSPLEGSNSVERKIFKYSPADTDQLLSIVPIDPQHVDPIIDSAAKGYRTWRRTSLDDRSKLLRRYQEEVTSRKEEIATAISLETGKPYWEALTEVAAVIAKVDVTLEQSLPRIKDYEIKNIMSGVDGQVQNRPIGICLIIGPFNFLCHLANGQILAALAAGNSIIFKPSEKTPYSGQLLIECFHSAGFPEGVVNFIQGDPDIVRRLLSEKQLKGVFFTGSKEAGLSILKETYRDLSKLVALELGGKNTCIVHKDAHIQHSLAELLKASYMTTGQRCVSTSKIAIHRSIKDEFIERFHAYAKRIIVDHPIEHDQVPFMGPLIDAKSLDNYLVFMGMAIREGAQEVMRGKQLQRDKNGFYVSPSIHYVDKLDPKSHFLSSEIFGPNCTFIPYDEIEEAVEIANCSEFGLASGVFSQDSTITRYCLEELETGVINLNRSTCGSSSKLPFGGIKSSGNYRPAAVSMIDACIHPVSSLQQQQVQDVDIDAITGIKA